MDKQVKKITKTFKKTSTIATVFAVVLLLVHGLWLITFRKKLEVVLDQRTTSYNIGYESRSMRPRLFGVKNTISDLRLSFISQKQNYEVIFKKFVINSSMFSRKHTISIPKGAIFNGENPNGLKADFVEELVVFTAKKNSVLMPTADIKIKEVRISDEKAGGRKNFCVLNNFSLNTVSDLVSNHIDSLFNLNIDAIKIKKNNDDLESNLEIVISSSNGIGSDGKIISIDTKIESLLVSDITNNYGISVTGGIRTTQVPRTGVVDIEFKIINFNSMLAAIENKDSELIVFNRNILSNTVQVLGLIPENPKDTDSEKYYRIVSDRASNTVTVNGVDSEAIIKKLLFISDENRDKEGGKAKAKDGNRNEDKDGAKGN
ncbi:MAG: hypothetical protein LBB24_03460 [Rickettsiales bacterium]|jgi:hypothetical protein|nr:hypothetical protein [Rickettsiales bacterium]